ncbi:TetR family transcriptional regulator [Rhodococcus sp. Leaf7]|uniref:TetR/AcrR family transcriptional regulator n=1 Tax=unclassified Rhodococcus (in: high G+C Gram-positive bacteria) TaxID=192944 RepID=UPI0007009F39|nr:MULTISPECIES: TetR family transcriptional regulator [unclassified Rhodococcus (in: high G+C Gram-positive bacteria)]KQU07111.1 TetR family transcriptional regulator [Rhodococcus sp. Leaf7]KQU42629.1 TetR family transcriptional regulator [Rhodococcus sp. Leaf247]
MGAAPTDAATRSRRNDPHRRDRIIDACLDVIAQKGVAGASHRTIAAVADVPLGSMTYHFTGMEGLLHEAFSRFADTVADRFDRRMMIATTRSEAYDAVIDVIIHEVFGNERDLVLTYELYTLAARNPAFREITHTWMARSRAVFERWFDPATAHMLDALVEGLASHRNLDMEPADDAITAEAVRRILG